MNTTTYSAVRARLAQTLRSLEAGSEPVLISRRDQPVGVLMSWAQYQESSSMVRSGFSDALLRWRAAQVPEDDAAATVLENDPFDGVRDRSAARPSVTFE